MAGLVPAIHDFGRGMSCKKSWVPALRPGMTE